MTYQLSVHAQDSSVGRVSVVLDSLADASEQAGGYEYVDVAVAYASSKGVQLLDEKLSGGTWGTARKRFLVSIDFGFTQPQALVLLSKLPNAEVRIPNGRGVLSSSNLRPKVAFHAKTFTFRGEEWFRLNALVVGSANLTASALTTGAEVVTKQVWNDNAFPSEARKFMENTRPFLEWFEDAWRGADQLSDVLDEYRKRHRKLPKPRQPPEEKTLATRRYLASPESHSISGQLSVQLSVAKSLWVHGSSIIQNRGKASPGNQVNTPRGTRVFFGFGSKNVPKDTTLGSIYLRVGNHAPVKRSVRFANNGMDIVGLPIPEQNGLETYLDTFLVFSRDRVSKEGIDQFTLIVTDAAGVARLKTSAATNVDLSMHGGRSYGLLF